MSQSKNQHPIRKESIDKLRNAMIYPGRFPILVLGESGTGKTHWILEIVKSNLDFNYFKNGVITQYGGLCDDNIEFWNSVLCEAHEKVLIIEEVEKLSSKSQDLLFDAISTTNGKYGFRDKQYEMILIFTSTFPIKKIRDDRRYLSAKFFDRISQFVVEFPNFKETKENIYFDFKTTWNKMFQDVDCYRDFCPRRELIESWLKTDANKMFGNFRDLDKIVINWNLHQRDLYNFKKSESKNNDKEEIDRKILKIIKDDFKNLLHNPSQKIYEDNTFVFDEDSDYGAMVQDFRKKLKKWALAMNNNDKVKASTQLKVSHRTMERWN